MSPYKSPLREIQSVCDGRCPLCIVRNECRKENIMIGKLAEVAEQDTWEDDNEIDEWDEDNDDPRNLFSIEDSSYDREDSDLGNER